MQMAARVRGMWSIELSIRSVLEHPTIARLAEYVDTVLLAKQLQASAPLSTTTWWTWCCSRSTSPIDSPFTADRIAKRIVGRPLAPLAASLPSGSQEWKLVPRPTTRLDLARRILGAYRTRRRMPPQKHRWLSSMSMTAMCGSGRNTPSVRVMPLAVIAWWLIIVDGMAHVASGQRARQARSGRQPLAAAAS